MPLPGDRVVDGLAVFGTAAGGITLSRSRAQRSVHPGTSTPQPRRVAVNATPVNPANGHGAGSAASGQADQGACLPEREWPAVAFPGVGSVAGAGIDHH